MDGDDALLIHKWNRSSVFRIRAHRSAECHMMRHMRGDELDENGLSIPGGARPTRRPVARAVRCDPGAPLQESVVLVLLYRLYSIPIQP